MKSDLSPSATSPLPLVNTFEMLQPESDGWFNLHISNEVREQIIAALRSTASETATPYAYEYVDKEGVETFTFQPPDRLKDAHEYKCTPLYKAPVSATREKNAEPQAGGGSQPVDREQTSRSVLETGAIGDKIPADLPAVQQPDDKNGAPRRGDGLKLYASIFREFFPNHQGEIELSAAVLEEMAERISLAWTTPSATRTISGINLIKAMRDQRDECADALRRLAEVVENNFPMPSGVHPGSPLDQARKALANIPTYEQRLRNIAAGIGMPYEELIASIDAVRGEYVHGGSNA